MATTTDPTIHHATRGFGDSQSYDTHRPSYPAEAVKKLLANLNIEGKAGAKILDLAAGTGKFTELLVAQPEAYEILAVEPMKEMREVLEAKKLERVKVQVGTADKVPDVPDEWADAVVVAQAFHWFAKEEALKEIRRALKPGGKLGLIWNIEYYNQPAAWTSTTSWERQLNELSFSLPPDGQSRFRHYEWPQVWERQETAEKPLFATPLNTATVPWTTWLTPEKLRDRVNTLSWVAVLDDEARKMFDEKFDKIVKEGDGKWNEKGEIEFHGSTFFAWAARL